MIFGKDKDAISELPQLQAVSSTKYLGVVIDNSLSWQDHIDALCNKLSCALFALRRIQATSTPEALTTAYHALFESKLRYGIAAWGGSSLCYMERVLLQQKKAVRIMTGIGWRDSCRDHFKQLNLLTVVNIYILEVVLLATSCQLTRQQDLHGYHTRNTRNFNLPAHRRKFCEKKPTYAGAKYFNALPQELKRSTSRQLKVKLSRWLLERPFYSIGEFLDWKNFQF